MQSTKEIDTLTRQRASYKGQLTTFSRYLSTLESSKFDALGARELQMRITNLEMLYNKYDNVQLQLECESGSTEELFTERTNFENTYFKCIVNAQQMLSDYNDTLNHDKKVESPHSCHSGGHSHKLVKLPTIQLPKFSGSYNNWLEFRDTFTSLIHDNDEIDVINKFHYLRSSLEGSAAVVLQSVEFSSQNYEMAWRLLTERYDNKRLLINNHVTALFNLESISKESSTALKHFIDQLNKNLRALQSLGEPIQHWDTIIIHIVTQKLDLKSLREWEEFKGRLDKNEPIKFSSLIGFLNNRADLIETLELSRFSNNNHSNLTNPNKNSAKLRSMVSVQSTSTLNTCPKCQGDHHLNNCPQFLSLSNSGRKEMLATVRVCHNCLHAGHYSNQCKKTGCKVCKRKHHTLIHLVDFKSDRQIAQPSSNHNVTVTSSSHSDVREVQSQTHPTTQFASSASVSNRASQGSGSGEMTLTAHVSDNLVGTESSDVLLSTALVKILDSNNTQHIVRAVLDSGSTSSLMTNQLCERLNLPVLYVDKCIEGINNSKSKVGQVCSVSMTSLNESFSTRMQCFVLPSITNNVPGNKINISDLNIPSDICLADPHFYRPSAVDMIIGADLFWDLIGSEKIRLGTGKPILQDTRLGWLVSGPINSGHSPLESTIICNFLQVESSTGASDMRFAETQSQLSRFWQLEEISHKDSHYSPEEKRCEEHFINNTTRLDNGRFCVRIPFKKDSKELGESISRAKQCFLSLERRNDKQPLLGKMYREFMSEYEQLGHMSEVPLLSEQKTYFIPHHGVLRESSTTTKLRAVFNASAPTSSGVSLNNIQMVGPTVQDDLLSILIRFRFPRYILSADIEKMYRQIIIHPEDRPLHQIIWREDASCPLKAFRLNTVTYGTASAPYLATRCLKQLGLECVDKTVSEIIIHDFYVDDLLTGVDQLKEAVKIQQVVTSVLSSACLPLRKWKSNEPTLIPRDSDQSTESSLNLNIGNNEPTKTLGLSWQPISDQLLFPIGCLTSNGNSKRDVLSVIAQIYDPLGLLSPCVILLKMLLQRLWLLKLTWDEPLPEELFRSWSKTVSNLSALNHMTIPRRVVCDGYNKKFDLHIFADASELAYGACVYVRSVNEAREVVVRILIAKSRVAPIKPTTIPRLELCAALVGARLYQKVINSLRDKVGSTTLWSDSMVVLGWLNKLPSKLEPFVRNRVATILEDTERCIWRHVPTDQNPADLISRGIQPEQVHASDLWWTGPSFLKLNPSHWPTYTNVTTNDESQSTKTLHCQISQNTDIKQVIIFNRFSNLLRLIRTVAYMLRFLNIYVLKREVQPAVNYKYVAATELQHSVNFILPLVQKESFPEYELLLHGKSLPPKSRLLKFNVFIDSNKIMRVGGRLSNSNFPHDKKFPILLQSTHHFSVILFRYEHNRLLHAGPQLLLASIRETYWPIGGRYLAKATYRKCVKCTRERGKVVVPQMGNLPTKRVTPGTYPFENVGIDYAGPMNAVSRQGRGCRVVKVYIAVFVCLATKCMHLELVGDLTSKCFLLALRRFISRRGKPSNIFSDNGTSFVGASNELSHFLKSNCDSLGLEASNEGIQFNFIPAYAPHFGGLWEAGVKSTKFHLVRVLGHCNLTYEELNTTLVQIEAVLNSRPLTPLSSDPADCTPLTPGHFLIGRPFTCLPTEDLQGHPVTGLSRFNRIEQLRQQFWSRWNKEYVSELQQRVKWRTDGQTLKPNMLVVIKEDNLPPLRWKLGRVIAVYPGSDGISRVADIKTTSGVVRRAFSKICPLLEEESFG